MTEIKFAERIVHSDINVKCQSKKACHPDILTPSIVVILPKHFCFRIIFGGTERITTIFVKQFGFVTFGTKHDEKE
jgi:hypothetical protein